MRLRFATFILVLAATVCAYFLTLAGAQRGPSKAKITSSLQVPAPQDSLGFTPGDDRKLASWNQILAYFEKLDRASDRVKFETLGKTTMEKPFVLATISAPENLARLEEYKRIQDQLADPRKLGPNPGRKAAELIGRGKTIVLITCGIHSTEVGSTLSSTLIAHRLASSSEPEIQHILRNTIILLVPSLNPDGVDIVKNWYDKTLGTPYEGTEPPELYHKYVGHDNNRDWYAFTQVETQITVNKIHNVWHPQIVHDIHQQGAFGSRLFLPPYMPPVEPNVPKQIVEGYTELGNWMAREMRAKGFMGITTNSTYDAWTPARAYSHYHAGVRMLSETASARLATPITLKFEELRSREGYDPQKESDKFGPVWRGGEWQLRDITNYMTSAAFLLLRHAAENREHWLRRFYEIGREAVRPRRAGELTGFVISLQGEDLHSLSNFSEISSRAKSTSSTKGIDRISIGNLLKILLNAGLEIYRVEMANSNQRVIQRGDYFIPVSQPYGAFAIALLRTQRYPDLRDKEGHPVAPYDVTAHALSLLMSVDVGEYHGDPFKELRLLQLKPPVRVNVIPCSPETPCLSASPAIYKSNVPSMDEGWTRWVLEQYAMVKPGHLSLNDRDIRGGNLIAKYKTIIIPDQSPRTILNGHRIGLMPPEDTGGLGPEGIKGLREFVAEGGTLVFLNRASELAIEQFKLPLRNVVAGLPRTDFYVPGSILRIQLDTSHPIAAGMPKESVAWVQDSPAFEVVENENATVSASAVNVIAQYPANQDLLLSGWLLGEDRIKGKAALVEVRKGKGRIILFGFRPQYRAQSLATYPLLFNALAGK